MAHRSHTMVSRHGFLNPPGTDATSVLMTRMNMLGSVPPRPADKYMEELWQACAGPLVCVPKVGQHIWYFSQGHMEQVAVSTHSTTDKKMPQFYNLPSQILCRVMQLSLNAEPETDDVYAQLSLLPEPDNNSIAASSKDEQPTSEVKRPVRIFTKILTASDTSTHGGFSVHRKHAEECLPLLDMSQEAPSQELVAIDLHGQEWKFRHTYRGHPRRHLLTTGWSYFVSQKKLAAGDAVIFLRGENDELRVGIRRVKRLNSQSSKVLSSDSMHMAVVATASYAVQTKTMFAVYYRPRLSPSSFLVPVEKMTDCLAKVLSVGMRFKMKYDIEDASERSIAGTITGIDDVDPSSWPNSKWRSLRVNWDEITMTGREDRVSPWEIELNVPSPLVNPLPASKSKRVRRSSELETGLGNSLKAALLEPMSNPGGQRIGGVVNEGLQDSHLCGNSFPYEHADSNLKMNGMVMPTETWIVQHEGRSKENYMGIPSVAVCVDGSHSVDSQERFKNVISGSSGVSGGNGQFCSFSMYSEMNACIDPSKAVHVPSLGTVSQVVQSSQLQSLPSSCNSLTYHWPHRYAMTYTASSPSNASWSPLDYSANYTRDRLDKPAGEIGCKVFGVCLKEPKLSMSSAWKTPKCGYLIEDKDTQAKQSQQFTHGNDMEKSMPESSCKLFGFSLPSTPRAAKASKHGNASEEETRHVGLSVQDHACPLDPAEIPLAAVKLEASSEVVISDNSVQEMMDSGRQPTTSSLSRSCTKVIMKRSMVGRGVDLSKFDCYERLIEELEIMFHIEGELSNPAKGWRVAYADSVGNMMHVGDDPWAEFCNLVWKIYIIGPGEAEVSNIIPDDCKTDNPKTNCGPKWTLECVENSESTVPPA